MTRRHRGAVLLVAATALLALSGSGTSTGVVTVAPGESVAAAVARHPDAVVELAPGRHEAFTVDRPAVIRAAEGATVAGGVAIRSDDVTLDGLAVEGGETGINVRDSGGVALRDVTVERAVFGIDANDASVAITGCAVTGVPTDMGQGIEIRNSNGRARSRVEGCRVEGGREGIVSHVSRVEIRGNEVTGTAMRGIAVTEMSEGLVEGNTVRGGVGTGLFCGDMSHCEIRGNRVSGIAADPAGIRSRSGQGLVAWYYATLRAHDNDFDVTADPAVDVYHGSVEVERFPLSHWPPGWRGALPALGVIAIALGALGALAVLARPLVAAVRRRGPTAVAARRPRATLGRDLLITTGVVQALHVGEHVVQVFQVHVADAADRQGLAGQHFDTEWLHLGFNGVVLAGMAAGTWLARHELARLAGGALHWLLAAAAVQTWHVAEHVVRVVQYLATGVSPAPGIVGDDLGLVWFHFGINVPVFAGLLIAGAVAAKAGSARRPAPTSRRDTAPAALPA